MADGIQRAIITVTLHDNSENPLPNLKVLLSSNRGDIDEINALTAFDGDILGSGENFSMSNSQGMAFFEVKSVVPGKAVFTPLADSLVTLDSVNITFLPLPFPKNVTVSLEVPKFIAPSGKIDIFKPDKEKSEKDQELVNFGVDLRVPFWLVVLILSSVMMNILLFILVLIMAFKVRKTNKKEDEILEKEEEVLEKIS